MRGEHSSQLPLPIPRLGSSPHARGALHGDLDELRRSGIIPACAGSTPSCTGASRPRRDHPRMRGEHLCRKCVDSIRRGSSPHARGARPMERAQHRAEGIIPACAGSTRGAPWTICSRRDHPRMRGEHVYFIDKSYRQRGSSPHARGAHQSLTRLSGGTRIIPACAGSTAGVRYLLRLRRDHPRMRGEHPARPMALDALHGSSPHARGARPPALSS